MDNKIKKYAVIVAGGTGSRLGGGLPKQFREIDGRPMVWWSMKAFMEADSSTHIILVIHPDYVEAWKELCSGLPDECLIEHEVVSGGASRTESVINGLSLIPDGEDFYVAVHDAARPLVSPEMIKRGWKAGRENDAAVPVIPVTDSLRILTGDVSEAVDRSRFVAVQTPQVFRVSLLKQAYEISGGAVFSDDASAVEAAGYMVGLYEGSPDNIKVTNPGDIEVAMLRMKKH